MKLRKRDYGPARAKVDAEGMCRMCGAYDGVQAAHIVPRSRLVGGEGAEDPRNIIPLCFRCHGQQHAGDLELLPLMTHEEQGYVASLVGITEALKRTTAAA